MGGKGKKEEKRGRKTGRKNAIGSWKSSVASEFLKRTAKVEELTAFAKEGLCDKE